MINKYQKGFSLIEVMVGLAIIILTVTASSLAFQMTIKAVARANRLTQAAFLLEEGVEAVKLIRGNDWTNLAGLNNGTAYTLVFNNNAFATQTTRVLINGLFDRTVTLAAVYRDSNDNIASAGTLDPNTKKVTVTVAWRDHNSTTTKNLITYVADI